MPWHQMAMKDVVNCEKFRRAVSKLRPGNIRMGQPNTSNVVLPARGLTRGTETSKYPQEEKVITIS